MNENQESRRELNKRQCRKRILKASRRLFSANGYEDTTMDDVAKRAEVSRATLYNYFPSKESLLMGIAEAELDDMCRLINEELKEQPRYLLKLRSVLEVFVYDTVSYIALARKITYLNACPESAMYSTRLDMLKMFSTLVEGAQRQGDFCADVPVNEIVHMVMGVYLVAQFEWPKIADYTQQHCTEKLRWFFNHMMAGVLTEAGKQLLQ